MKQQTLTEAIAAKYFGAKVTRKIYLLESTPKMSIYSIPGLKKPYQEKNIEVVGKKKRKTKSII